MRKTKIIFVLPIAAVLSLTSCNLFGKKSEEKEVDSTMAQLEISTFDGGVGDEWLKKAADLFVQKNKDRTDFEEGKVGCQIHIQRERLGGDSLLSSDLKKDIYFTENVDYYRLTNLNKFADITDILTAANPDDGGKTILSKIDSNLTSFMNRDGKYYAVPFYDCIYGLVYDKDLFSQYSFYMKDDGSFTNNPAEFGTGPNGYKGDWDDGLPKTYAQFAAMMQQMKIRNVTPFVYSNNSQVSRYTARGLMSYWSDDEGFDNTQLNYNFNGPTKIVKGSYDSSGNFTATINAGVPELEDVTITKDNGYLLKRQPGVYNALNFADTVLCSSSDNYKPAADNTAAQTEFVNNKDMGGSVKPIAMLFEGTWWENESVSAFDIAKRNRDSFNYGVMAIPKSSEDKVGENATFLNLNNSYGFINANTKQMKLAKEFFQFVHTDDQLRQFTMTTSMTRGLDYTLTEADMSKVTSFAKDLIAIKQSERAKLVYSVSGEKFFIDHADTFDCEEWLWGSTNLGVNPIPKFIADNSLTAESYFNSHVSDLTAAEWGRIIS